MWGIRNTGPLAPGVPPAADPYEQQQVDLRNERGAVNVVQLAAVLVIIVCIVWLVLLIV